MTTHKDFYGNMFPDVLPEDVTGKHTGKTFSYSIENIGLSRGQHNVDVDRAAWDDCLQCP